MAIDDNALQRYFDGELSRAEASDLEHELAADPLSAARLEQLRRLSRLMTAASDDAAKSLDSDGLFARIEAVRSHAAGKSGPLARSHPAAPNLLERVWSWIGGLAPKRQVWMPVAGATVMAAAVLLTFFVPEMELGDEVARPVGSATEPASLTGQGSEVVVVDFGDHVGTLFEVFGADGRATPVVWINDHGE
ncbi:MAG: hypothetical protein MJD61_22680 [Proteobacteria bacterium]|nr:hypothetical protein [Pseudomonadota bacterium]